MLDNFVAQYSGTKVGTNDVNFGECVGLVMKYVTELGLPWFSGNAKDLLSTAPSAHFTVITNDAANPDQIPSKGDIVVFSDVWGAGFGHTGICLSAVPNGFVLFEQNNPVGAAPHLVTHPASHYSTVLGWLTPIVTPQEAQTVKEDYNAIAPSDFVTNFYTGTLGRLPESTAVTENRMYGELYYSGLKEVRETLLATQSQVTELTQDAQKLQEQLTAAQSTQTPVVPQTPAVAPQDTPSAVKPGVKTTEFWLSASTILATIAATIPATTPWTAKIVLFATNAATAIGYALGRSNVKTNSTK